MLLLPMVRPSVPRPPYLSCLLQKPPQVLAVGLGAAGAGAAVLQLGLQLQQAAHVVGLLGGRLLQQRGLVALPVLRHLALGGVGLAERLRMQRGERGELVTVKGSFSRSEVVVVM